MQRKAHLQLWLPSVSPGASPAHWMSKSKYFTAGFVTPTSISPGMNGTTRFIPACRAMRSSDVSPALAVGIVGLGGLGHMGVKFARAFGAHVVLFTTSPNKIADGLRLGAHEVVVSKDADAMKKHQGSFNFILDAVSAQHDINAYLSLLKLDGTLTLVGAPEQPLPVTAFNLLLPRRNFAGSAIGGIAETQEMLDSAPRTGSYRTSR